MREVGRTLATAPRSRARYKLRGTTSTFPKRQLPSRRQRCGWTPVRPRRDTSPALEPRRAARATRHTPRSTRCDAEILRNGGTTAHEGHRYEPKTRLTSARKEVATERPVTPSRRDSPWSACRDSSSPRGHGLSRHVPLFLFLQSPTGPPRSANRCVRPSGAHSTYAPVRLAALLGSPCAASKIGSRTQTARST